jgi:hypothetical protein
LTLKVFRFLTLPVASVFKNCFAVYSNPVSLRGCKGKRFFYFAKFNLIFIADLRQLNFYSAFSLVFSAFACYQLLTFSLLFKNILFLFRVTPFVQGDAKVSRFFTFASPLLLYFFTSPLLPYLSVSYFFVNW